MLWCLHERKERLRCRAAEQTNRSAYAARCNGILGFFFVLFICCLVSPDSGKLVTDRIARHSIATVHWDVILLIYFFLSIVYLLFQMQLCASVCFCFVAGVKKGTKLSNIRLQQHHPYIACTRMHASSRHYPSSAVEKKSANTMYAQPFQMQWTWTGSQRTGSLYFRLKCTSLTFILTTRWSFSEKWS